MLRMSDARVALRLFIINRAASLFRHQLLREGFSSALYGFARKGHLRSPLLREIFPPWILRLDQSNLLRSRPALQLLLPSNRLVNILEALVINEPIAPILAGKPFDVPVLMLQGTAVDAVGHADVKRSRTAANDIDEIVVIPHANSLSS